MKRIEELLTDGVTTVGIAGHVNPDGDCVGSTTALRLYLLRNYPRLAVDLYLEEPKASLLFMPGAKESFRTPKSGKVYDLFITCDVSSVDRIGVAGGLFAAARRTACIDHHETNDGFAGMNHIEAGASSCAEVLANLLDNDKTDRDMAVCLYTGIIHDTGVFQYSSTSPRTMITAARLMSKGIPFNRIIEESFNERTYVQNRILGYTLEKMKALAGGRIVAATLTRAEMEVYGANLRDIDGIVAEMRKTTGCEAAVFIYETRQGEFKVSLRSNSYLNVANVAAKFGGGGHAKAAGCTLAVPPEAAMELVVGEILPRLREK